MYVINKVHITDEARFDFEEVIACRPMPIATYKKDLEEYFKHVAPFESYFTKKIYDEDICKMLLLFFRKGKLIRTMQIWLLAGICDISDYDEVLEDSGLIKNWLDSRIAA